MHTTRREESGAIFAVSTRRDLPRDGRHLGQMLALELLQLLLMLLVHLLERIDMTRVQGARASKQLVMMLLLELLPLRLQSRDLLRQLQALLLLLCGRFFGLLCRLGCTRQLPSRLLRLLRLLKRPLLLGFSDCRGRSRRLGSFRGLTTRTLRLPLCVARLRQCGRLLRFHPLRLLLCCSLGSGESSRCATRLLVLRVAFRLQTLGTAAGAVE